MKRPLLRFAMAASAVWAFLAVASLYSYYLSRSTPDWYLAPPAGSQQEQTDANATGQKIADLFSYAGDVAAAQRRHFLAGAPLAASGIGPKTVSLSEAEINAFAATWQQALSREDAALTERGAPISHYVHDGRVALENGGLLVAARLSDLGMLSESIASVEFRPIIDDQNRLWPRLHRIYSGRLPIPSGLLSTPRAKLAAALQVQVAELWIRAATRRDGLADAYTAAAVAGRVLLAAINDQATEPVILLPCLVGDAHRTVPLRVTQLQFADGRLTATLRPLTSDELAAFIAELRRQ